MSVLAESQLLVTDGDAAFLRVDNRRPPHALEPGVAASATNLRFDQGKPRPRLGVAVDAWGRASGYYNVWVTWQNTSGLLETSTSPGWATGDRIRVKSTDTLPPELAEDTDYYVVLFYGASFPNLWALYPTAFDALGHADDAPTGAWINLSDGNSGTLSVKAFNDIHTCAYRRFSDPTTDTDNGILITDAWRSDGDGGKGRAWRIISGNEPQEISLNGHDVWGTCRLIPCHNAVVLLRHGVQRHYFIAADVENGPDRIQLHLAPNWAVNSGKRVRFELAQTGSAIYGTAPPAPGNYYYAKHITGNKIELYSDVGLTNILSWEIATNPPVGKFYIEVATDPAPLFGNGPSPLIMQPNGAGATAFENGFKAVTVNVVVTGTNATSDVITAPNHRLKFGDAILVTGVTGLTSSTTYYAAPQSEHTLRAYDTLINALADDGTTGKQDLTVDDETGSLKRLSAAGLPMPPGREGCYLNGRLWLVNGDDELLYSDPFDFLHYTAFTNQVTANQGEAGRVNWLLPIGEDAMAIGKDQKIIGLSGISGPVSGWREGTITQEYGGIAALAALNLGSDAWFASRKGFASAIRTVAGEKLGVARPVSSAIPEQLKGIDWSQAGQMAAETWNNRLFWGVPLKGQETPINNAVLVLNFDNQQLYVEQAVLNGQIVGGVREGSENQKGPDSWEGQWMGDMLTPYAFARLTVNGEERLTWATPDGTVCWFHDGWDDAGEAIACELVTRGYFGSANVLALRGAVNAETFEPKISVQARAAGYKEQVTLIDELEYSRTAYALDGVTAYDPDTSTTETFEAPHRDDYSPSPEELFVAELDVHQSHSIPLRLRIRDHAIQLAISNTQGSVRICSAALQAKPIGVPNTSKT